MKTEPAKPALRLSALMVTARKAMSAPISESAAKSRLVAATMTAPSSSGRMMPKRTTSAPPRKAPRIDMTRP